MDVKTWILTGAGAIFVVFMLMTFFYSISNNYNIYENQSIGNVSLGQYRNMMNNTEAQSKRISDIFRNDTSLLDKAFLAIGGIIGSFVTVYEMSIGSITLIFSSVTGIFNNQAVSIAVGFFISIIVILLILAIWDWIRGGSSG